MPRELIDIEAARRMVLEQVMPLEAEDVRLRGAMGRVLAAGIEATEPIPPFDNSAMDGYALRSDATSTASRGDPVRLAVVDEARAGRPARATAEAGEAIAISTGAVMPGGCDAVVRLEHVNAREGVIEVRTLIEPGREVRHAGDDVKPGELVMPAGTVIGAAEVGVLASLGRSSAPCARAPRIGVL